MHLAALNRLLTLWVMRLMILIVDLVRVKICGWWDKLNFGSNSYKCLEKMSNITENVGASLAGNVPTCEPAKERNLNLKSLFPMEVQKDVTNSLKQNIGGGGGVNNNNFGEKHGPRLTSKKLEDRRVKGLCYWCNEKYSLTHAHNIMWYQWYLGQWYNKCVVKLCSLWT